MSNGNGKKAVPSDAKSLLEAIISHAGGWSAGHVARDGKDPSKDEYRIVIREYFPSADGRYKVRINADAYLYEVKANGKRKPKPEIVEIGGLL